MRIQDKGDGKLDTEVRNKEMRVSAASHSQDPGGSGSSQRGQRSRGGPPAGTARREHMSAGVPGTSSCNPANSGCAGLPLGDVPSVAAKSFAFRDRDTWLRVAAPAAPRTVRHVARLLCTSDVSPSRCDGNP